jgi:hypothetical protein
MDGWMAGLGTAQPPSTDALGQLLSEYAKRVYTSQLQHLKVLFTCVMLPYNNFSTIISLMFCNIAGHSWHIINRGG